VLRIHWTRYALPFTGAVVGVWLGVLGFLGVGGGGGGGWGVLGWGGGG